MKKFLIVVLLSSIFISCKKGNNNPGFSSTDKGNIEIEFDNVAGAEDLVLNTGVYTNSTGETYIITKLNYYISNIILKNENGTDYIVPQDDSYFLIKEDDESTHVAELDNIPAGNYTGITFTVGIDSMKSVATAEHTGILTQTPDMYWSFNEGFVFLDAEGTSAVSPTGNFVYKIGGYGGTTTSTINNLKTVTLSIPGETRATIRKDITPEMHLFVDAKKIMDGSTNVSIATHNNIAFDAYSTTIANNYAAMFKIDHVHND